MTIDLVAVPRVYVTTAWGNVYASVEAAKAGCDEYLSRCYVEGKPHVENGTDADGWFQTTSGEWRRFVTDHSTDDPLKHPAQSIQERVVLGGTNA